MRRAASRADCTAGNNRAIKTAMIAITTRSSISVKPRRSDRVRCFLSGFICFNSLPALKPRESADPTGPDPKKRRQNVLYLANISRDIHEKQHGSGSTWRELAMEVHLDSEESTTPGNKETGKRRRPGGRTASLPAEVANQTGRLLVGREPEWPGATSDPAGFAAVELEVHEQARRQADLYVGGLLAKASEDPETADHVHKVIAVAELPLHPVEKKPPLDWSASGGPGDHGDPCIARRAHGPARAEVAREVGFTRNWLVAA